MDHSGMIHTRHHNPLLFRKCLPERCQSHAWGGQCLAEHHDHVLDRARTMPDLSDKGKEKKDLSMWNYNDFSRGYFPIYIHFLSRSTGLSKEKLFYAESK
jgi:hypothetical protein